jgi:hypothetical protein
MIRAHGAFREVEHDLIFFFSPSAGGLKADDMESRIASNQKGREIARTGFICFFEVHGNPLEECEVSPVS